MAEPPRIRVLLVDDHAVIRDGIRMVLESADLQRRSGLSTQGPGEP
jgi:DNA-binding NarL/FixJ family response regulator